MPLFRPMWCNRLRLPRRPSPSSVRCRATGRGRAVARCPATADVANAGADVPQPADAGADAPQPADAVDAGADAGADSLAGPVWQKVENVVNDPFDDTFDIVVAVDPVNQHVYVMWVDWSSSAVKVKRWNRLTGKWGDTHTLEDNASGNPEIIQVGVDGAGNAIAAWQHSVSSDTTLAQIGGVRVSRTTDGESWSAAESVTPLRQVVEMRMAVARNGQARIAFTERLTSSPYTEQLYSAHFDGTTWTSGPNPLAPEDPNDQAATTRASRSAMRVVASFSSPRRTPAAATAWQPPPSRARP